MHLLTYSMVQSPWEANWFAASQEISRISRNPKVRYRTHKPPSPVSILGQPNPVHIPTSHLLEIIPNIIHSTTPRSPQWSPSLQFPHKDPIHPPLLTHTCHMPSPSHGQKWIILYREMEGYSGGLEACLMAGCSECHNATLSSTKGVRKLLYQLRNHHFLKEKFQRFKM